MNLEKTEDDKYVYYKLILPYRIKVGVTERSKYYTLNKNQERNWHYQLYNNLKKSFSSLVKDIFQFEDVPKNKKFEIDYVFYNYTKAKSDPRNYIDIVDKFLTDALQQEGLNFVEEDNYDYYIGGNWKYGGYKKNHWYIETTIKFIKNE